MVDVLTVYQYFIFSANVTANNACMHISKLNWFYQFFIFSANIIAYLINDWFAKFNCIYQRCMLFDKLNCVY